jgi:hypothetical protein
MFINYGRTLHLIQKNLVYILFKNKILFLYNFGLLFLLVENMHKYTTEITTDNIQRQDRNRYTLRHYFSEESSGSVCYFVVECTCYIFDIVACRLNDTLVLFMFYIFFINTSEIRKKKVR